MKIFFIIPTLSHGGAERVISELANSLSDRGYEVSVILWIGGNQFYKLNNNITLIDFNFVHNSKIDKIINLFRIIYKLRKLYKQEHPDIIISFLTRSNIISIISGFFLNLKIFISERNNPYLWDNNSKLLLFLRNFTYKKANGFIAQTEAAKKIAIQKFQIKSTVIVNPIKKISSFPNIKREKIILNIGRLHEQKGQKYLFEAFSKLNTKEWKLVILGEGPERQNLEKLARNLGIEKQLIMKGSVDNIDEWLAKASIFVFPSLYEGFPNALLEAMGAGVPSVSFDCDTGPRDLIKNGENGFLIPLLDVELFKENIQILIDNGEIRSAFSKESRNVNNYYSLEKITNQLLEFINDGDKNEKK